MMTNSLPSLSLEFHKPTVNLVAQIGCCIKEGKLRTSRPHHPHSSSITTHYYFMPVVMK